MGLGLSELLRRFLDLYERDRSACEIALDLAVENGFLDHLGNISPPEQLSLIAEASANAREQIRQKTLIEISDEFRHVALKEEIDRFFSAEIPEHIRSVQLTFPRAEELLATDAGLTIEEWRREHVRNQLSTIDTDLELLRLFAQKFEQIVDVINQLDTHPFSSTVPQRLFGPFRECHINFALGNYGTTVVLIGTLLEGVLKSLNVQGKELGVLIRNAIECGVLSGANLIAARRVQETRNALVHLSKPFEEVSSVEAAELLLWIRDWISTCFGTKIGR